MSATTKTTDRRSGADRRDASASTPPQGAELRSGVERRSPLRGALFEAGLKAENLAGKLAFKVMPLLALAEFAARASHSLEQFNFKADRDKAFRSEMDSLDPEWRYSLMTEDAPVQHIGPCLAVVRDLCREATEAAEQLAGEVHSASHQMEGGAQ